MHKDWHKLFDIIDEFMKRTHMHWNHHDWTDLLVRVEKAGIIMNPDELGRMIERERERRKKKNK